MMINHDIKSLYDQNNQIADDSFHELARFYQKEVEPGEMNILRKALQLQQFNIVKHLLNMKLYLIDHQMSKSGKTLIILTLTEPLSVGSK